VAEKDGEAQSLRSAALRNASAILAARQRAEQDLVQAKQGLEQLAREQAVLLAQMRATLEATTDAILVVDQGGHVAHFNENFARLWRLPAAMPELREVELLRDHVRSQVVDPGGFDARIKEIYADNLADTFDILETIDGAFIERHSRTQIIGGGAAGRVWSFRDVTEQHRSAVQRERLLESERAARSAAEQMMQAKDQFLATLSHELRTPLSAILGWTQLLKMGGPARADYVRGLETIERNARVQTRLIDDLLDMSRIASGKIRLDIQPVEPIAVIEAAIETIMPAAAAKGIRIERMLDPLAAPVSGDPNRLQQVVLNLLSNAIKFTPKQGKVQVTLERVNSHIEINIADTGIGIEAGFLPHVFERFQQADASSSRTHGGLGLGLAIVKSLVELHGGTVYAKSPGKDQGATFSIHLPVNVVHRTELAAGRLHPATPTSGGFTSLDLSGLRIVVVDDEPDARDLVQRILAECRAEIFTAESAAEALELIEDKRPDVLLSDIGMPQVDGFELLRMVRALGEARGGKLPAIALTAFARSEDRTRALRAGFLAHVSKPIEPSELVATIAAIAGRTGT
jgi:signal transduction histidine kinase